MAKKNLTPPPVLDDIVRDNKATIAFVRYLLDLQSVTESSSTDLTNVYQTLNKIIASVGLNSDGSFKDINGSNFIDNATYVMGAILELDQAIVDYNNFSFSIINKPITIPYDMQMTVFGLFELNDDLILNGDLILKD